MQPRQVPRLLVVAALYGVCSSVGATRSSQSLSQPGLVAPPVPDEGEIMATNAENSAWKAAGAGSEVRAHTSHLRAAVAQRRTDKAADSSAEASDEAVSIGPSAAASELAANASLTEAMEWHAKAATLINGVKQRAYFAAKATAEKDAAKLEAEAQEYFQTLLAEAAAKADNPGDARSEAAAKAAQPYVKVQLRAAAMVEAYNKKALDTLNLARAMVGNAVSIAYQAQREQASGNAEMAQRHMMQAHGLLGAAQVKKELAYKIRKLVDSLNSSIPSYQQAAANAVTHALAVFSGLQEKSAGGTSLAASGAEEFKAAFAAFDAAMADALAGPLRD